MNARAVVVHPTGVQKVDSKVASTNVVVCARRCAGPKNRLVRKTDRVPVRANESRRQRGDWLPELKRGASNRR